MDSKLLSENDAQRVQMAIFTIPERVLFGTSFPLTRYFLKGTLCIICKGNGLEENFDYAKRMFISKTRWEKVLKTEMSDQEMRTEYRQTQERPTGHMHVYLEKELLQSSQVSIGF